jgi:outer membrane protein insertion porin family
MMSNNLQATPELGTAPPVTYNRLFLSLDLISCSEGVLILPAIRGVQQNRRPSAWIRRPFLYLALIVLGLSAVSGWAQQQESTPQVVTSIRVIGNRRIPKETVLARLFTHVNDTYDPLTVERDFNSLWNTGYFEDVRIEKEDTPKGVILDIYVREKPTIREITYPGLNSVSQSDVLDRFKKEKVGLSIESQYDPTRIARARTVIAELLGEHGHQFATIRPEVKSIPPASVSVIFHIKEGPKVKVGRITFTGNQHMSALQLRRAMRNLRPVGIPYSIFLENLFAKSYDASKLEEDAERVRQAYRDKGYYYANVGDPDTHIRNEGGLSFFTFRPRKGKRIDIHLPIEEGSRYRLAGITFTGNKAVRNTKALRATFAMKDGSYFNYTAVGKGLQNLQKAYGELGYINFVAQPQPKVDEANKTVTLNIDIDEGKPFLISRIEFSGNTVTRDFVIRRELLVEEGGVYNSRLWEQSLLRLNQLDYFNPLKADQDSEAHQNPENNTVDLLLKVKEKGKNSIGLNGGVSGLSGSFLGLNYQTNNFLGLGETLTLQASLGNLARNLMLGFNEPYFRNRPLNLGFQLYDNKYDYNSAKNYKIATGGGNLPASEQSLVQNYNQSTTGFSLYGSYPIRRSFKRIGLTYTWNKSSITTFSQASSNLFETLAFRSGIQGANSLEGILNSSAAISFQSNTVDSNYRPRRGTEYSALMTVSGLWGNVRYISPTLEFKQFHAMKGFHFDPEGRNVLGYRMQLLYIRGFSGDVAPPFNRFYAGGEADLRGFDIRAATPYGFVPTRVQFNLTNPDGTCVPRDPTNPQENDCVKVPIPVYGIVSIGGDTQFTSNLEYRIPIAGPVDLKLFDDFGINTALDKGQLKQSPEGIAVLNSPLYGCPNYINGACQGGQQIAFNRYIRPISGTNLVPRMSLGAEVGVMLPIVRAPFRIYYAINPLRLEDSFPGQNLITRSMFPAGGAGDYSYAQAQQLYGSVYQLREPAKTFRLTVSTTF